jgi:hypothetical protein
MQHHPYGGYRADSRLMILMLEQLELQRCSVLPGVPAKPQFVLPIADIGGESRDFHDV